MYLFSRIGHLKKIILKGRGFRGGSDEKMRRMWFGIEIDVVGHPPLGNARSHKKFGPDRFSRFDVYWIQTNRQTDKKTDKPNLYIDDNNDSLIWERLIKRRIHFKKRDIIPHKKTPWNH